MKQNLRFFFMALLCAVCSMAWGETSSLTFTAACGGSGTANDGVKWTVTSDAAESTFDSNRGVHYGTNSKSVSELICSTTGISGTITKIVVNASGASGTSAKLDVTVGSEVFGSQQSLTSSATNYTFEGSASGEIVVRLSQTSATKALYLKSIVVTYTSGTTPSKVDIATLNSISPTQLYIDDEGTFDLDASFVEGLVADDDYEVTWESDNTEVLDVDGKSGEYQAYTAGTANITVTVTAIDDETYNDVSKSFEVKVLDPNANDGSSAKPYTVAEAISFIETLGGTTSSEKYVNGIVSQVDEVNGYATYWISDDGTTNTQLQVYRGNNINGASFANTDDLQVADIVTIRGNLKKYRTTPEFDTGSEIVTLTRKIAIAAINSISPTTLTVGDSDDFTLDATFVEGLTESEDYEINWSSDNTNVLEVAGSTYEAKAKGTANVTVSVTVLDEETYRGVSKSFAVIVTPAPVAPNPNNAKNINSNYYVKVTDADQLEDGDAILIVNEDYGVAMSTTQNENNRGKVSVSINDEIIINPSNDVQKIILTGAEDSWYFYTGGSGYLYAASSSSNYLKTTIEFDDNAKAKISIDGEGNATIQFQGTNTRNTIRFNPNTSNNNPLFSCYASGQKPVQIYKEVPGVAISNAGYATMYYGTKHLIVPAGVEAYTCKVESDHSITHTTTFTAREVIPAGTAVLLHATAGNYTFTESVNAGNKTVSENMLRGYDTKQATTGPNGVTDGYKFFTLSLNADNEVSSVGFYYMEENGAPFESEAHKAFLAVPNDIAEVSSYVFDDQTGIKTVEMSTNKEGIYTLSGVRMQSDNLPAGLYIVNGKKMIIK